MAQRKSTILVIIVVLLLTLVTTIKAQNTVTSVAWSPSGDKIAKSNDFTVQILSSASGQVLNTLPNFSEAVTALRWNPSGAKLAIATGKDIQIWDVTTSQILFNFQEHRFPVTAVSWSPDGSKIASASAEKTQIWNSITGQVLLTLTGHILPITDAEWSPDGTKVATSGYDSTIIVWDATTGQSLSIYIIQDSINPDVDRPPIFAIAWKDDGSRIAAASLDSLIRILDASNLQLLDLLKGHTDAAVSVAWSPNGLLMASGSVDGTIRVWDANTNQTIEVLQLNTTISSLDWSPDSNKLAYADANGTVQIVTSPNPTPTPTATTTPASTPTPGSSTFPTTGVLDNFNRADGVLGSSWTGYTSGITILNNKLNWDNDGDLYWETTSFNANQEAYVTLASIDANAAEIDLLLKVQGASWTGGVIEVLYNPAGNKAQVFTYSSSQGWVQRGADMAVTFAAGDQFGARAKANGTVEVYKNGSLLGSRDISGWSYNANGGKIGLWLIGIDSMNIDDFGGGNS